MHPRQRAPGAADCVERLAACLAEPGQVRHRLVDRRPRFGIVARSLDQAQRTDRQAGDEARRLRAGHRQLDAAAAQIAGDAVRIGNAGPHAGGRQPALAHAVDHRHLDAAAPLDLSDEGRPVLGIAHRRGRQHVEPPDAELARQHGEALDILLRQHHAFGIEPARAVEPAAERAHGLLVEQHLGRTAQSVIKHEAQRIRADVDDADHTAPTLRQRGRRVGGVTSIHRQTHSASYGHSLSRTSLGAPCGLCSAEPRPDRLGLVMK